MAAPTRDTTRPHADRCGDRLRHDRGVHVLALAGGLHVSVRQCPGIRPAGSWVGLPGGTLHGAVDLLPDAREIPCQATVFVGGLYAVWGVSPWAPRPDLLGLFWYGCLLGFLAWGRSRLLYVGAFVVVTYLELIGTWLGTWAWQPYDPTGLVTMGNPPSGAAGGYGWFDLAAITLAPLLLERWQQPSVKEPRTLREPPGEAGC